MSDEENYEEGAKRYEEEAEGYLDDKEKSQGLLKTAIEKARKNEGALGEAVKKLELLFEMLRAWIKGDYKMPKRSMVMVIAAIIYFVSPIDLIPDFIVGLGFFDDAAVISYTIKQIAGDIDKFEEWKKAKVS